MRILELILVYAVAPLFLLLGIFPRPWIIYLLVVAVPIILWLRVGQKKQWSSFWKGGADDVYTAELARIVSRFGMNAVGIVVLTFAWFPEKLLTFPGAFPFHWLAVMFLYPMIMVYPQELFFRMFFAERYGEVLRSKKWVIIVNALLFGWAHILFGSWIAVVLSGIGGALFMDTYLRTRSMKLVWIEHSLYGNLIFTIGLGEFFYSGWAG